LGFGTPSLIVCLIRAKLPSLSNHLPLTSEGACGDPFASAPWQPMQVPSAGLAVEADPHRARADSRSVDFIAGVNAQRAAQLGGRHCSVERGEDVVVYADLERLPPRFVDRETLRPGLG
jgi:hypothetical protein